MPAAPEPSGNSGGAAPGSKNPATAAADGEAAVDGDNDAADAAANDTGASSSSSSTDAFRVLVFWVGAKAHVGYQVPNVHVCFRDEKTMYVYRESKSKRHQRQRTQVYRNNRFSFSRDMYATLYPLSTLCSRSPARAGQLRGFTFDSSRPRRPYDCD